ncbi:MAG: VOC family protein [Planctomycetota bacterium]
MKRLHVHVAVADLESAIRFYSGLFAAEPSVREGDYAKWQLDDPRVNFAISARGKAPGIEHLGIEAEDAGELDELQQRVATLDGSRKDERRTTCCYAVSNKVWKTDPAGVSWELFHTLARVRRYGADPADGKAALPDEGGGGPRCCG